MIATRIGLLLIAAQLVCGCSDTVTSRYQTRADAEADNLIQRGWLPDIIPKSSYEITTTNHLDVNVSEGEFSFSPEHATGFVGRLRRMEASEISGADLERDYWPYAYQDDDSWWIFFINPGKGHCEYRMGLLRTKTANKAVERSGARDEFRAGQAGSSVIDLPEINLH